MTDWPGTEDKAAGAEQWPGSADSGASADAPKHGDTTTFLGEVGRGAMDPILGGEQLASHVAASDAGRGLMNILPGGGLLAQFLPKATTEAVRDYTDRAIKEREENIRAERGSDADRLDVGRMVGNVVSPQNLLPGLGLGGAAVKGGVTALEAAGSGMTFGALAGLSEPVTDSKNYETAKGTQVIGGSVLGGGLGLAGKVASPVIEAVGRQVLSKYPEAAENEAVRLILKRWGQDTKYGAGSAQDALDIINATDKPMALADVGGKNVRAISGSVARAPGESSQIADKFLNERNEQASQRLSQDITDFVHGGPSAEASVDTLLKARSVASKPLYEDARALEHVWNPRLDEFFANKYVKQGLAAGVDLESNFALARGRPMSFSTLGIDLDALGNVKLVDKPNLALLDMAKRGLDSLIAAQRDEYGRLSAHGVSLQEVRHSFVKEIDSLDKNGIYKKARDTWGGYSASKGAVELGQKFMTQGRSVFENEQEVAKLTPSDREFLRLGIASNLRARLNLITDISGDLKSATPLLQSKTVKDLLRPAFDSAKAYDDFIASVTAEHTMAKTRRNMLGGSASQERFSEEAESEVGTMVKKGKEFLTSGMFKKAAIMLDMFNNMGTIPSPKVREELAKILFTDQIKPAVAKKLTGQTAPPVNPYQGAADLAQGIGVGLAPTATAPVTRGLQ